MYMEVSVCAIVVRAIISFKTSYAPVTHLWALLVRSVTQTSGDSLTTRKRRRSTA